MRKQIYYWLFIIPCLLTGCATQKVVAYGTVMRVQKLEDKNYKPGKETAIGAGAGAVAGAVVGGTAGGALTLATLGLGAPLIPAMAAAGAAIGGGVGGGSGYAVGLYNRGKGLYQFQVQLDGKVDNLMVIQYMQQPVKVDERVIVYRKEEHLYLKKMENKELKSIKT